MKSSKTYIVLGTYNGSKYIADQIRSIQRQDITDWKLLVRDDGSADDTKRIIANFANTDDRIVPVDDSDGNLGVIRNYGKLMGIALSHGADIIFLSDQDDIWLSNKMSSQIKRMQELEYEHGQSKPILIHADLAVIDESLHTINQSFMRYQGIENEANHPLNILLVQNFVTGCSIALNRALLETVLPVPENVLMHDWWIALCAAVFGVIDYIGIPTVLYRQHSKNKIGAKRFWSMLNPLSSNLADRWKIGMKHFLGTIEQAQLLSEKISLECSDDHSDAAELITIHASCLSMKRIERLRKYFSARIKRQGYITQALLYLRLLAIPGQIT